MNHPVQSSQITPQHLSEQENNLNSSFDEKNPIYEQSVNSADETIVSLPAMSSELPDNVVQDFFVAKQESMKR